MSDKIRRYCCCQFQEFHLACHSQVWNVYNECAVCTVCAYNTVCAVILCTVIRCTVCKHIIGLFCSIIVWFIQECVGQKLQKMAMDTKTPANLHNYFAFITTHYSFVQWLFDSCFSYHTFSMPFTHLCNIKYVNLDSTAQKRQTRWPSNNNN